MRRPDPASPVGPRPANAGRTGFPGPGRGPASAAPAPRSRPAWPAASPCPRFRSSSPDVHSSCHRSTDMLRVRVCAKARRLRRPRGPGQGGPVVILAMLPARQATQHHAPGGPLASRPRSIWRCSAARHDPHPARTLAVTRMLGYARADVRRRVRQRGVASRRGQQVSASNAAPPTGAIAPRCGVFYRPRSPLCCPFAPVSAGTGPHRSLPPPWCAGSGWLTFRPCPRVRRSPTWPARSAAHKQRITCRGRSHIAAPCPSPGHGVIERLDSSQRRPRTTSQSRPAQPRAARDRPRRARPPSPPGT